MSQTYDVGGPACFLKRLRNRHHIGYSSFYYNAPENPRLTGFKAGVEELFHDELVGRVQGVVQQLQKPSALIPAIHHHRQSITKHVPCTLRQKMGFLRGLLSRRVHQPHHVNALL